MALRIGLLAVLAVPILYISSCTITSLIRNRAFDAVTIGDTAESVIRKMGEPSVRETPGNLFSRYAAKQCAAPCVDRLWYENRLTLDTEAWSIELDDNGRVIDKARWISP